MDGFQPPNSLCQPLSASCLTFHLFKAGSAPQGGGASAASLIGNGGAPALNLPTPVGGLGQAQEAPAPSRPAPAAIRWEGEELCRLTSNGGGPEAS